VTREDPQPVKTPMSALIDVVFLLLIYFVVTHVDYYEQTQDVSQKEGIGVPTVVEKSGFLNVRVAPDAYRLPDAKRNMTLDQIQDYLRTQLSFDPTFGVAVSVVPETEHRRVIALLDSCREVDVARFRMLGLSRN
jgi:biopolymer transport protein ExbD